MWNYCDQVLQFDFVLTHVPGTEISAADYLSRLDINSQDRIHLQLNEEIRVCHVEIDLATKTSKQDDSEEDYDPDKPSKKKPTTENPNVQSLLNAVQQLPNKSSGDFNTRLSEIGKQIEQHMPPNAPSMTFNRFVQMNKTNFLVDQVCPQGDSCVVKAQLSNSDVQTMVEFLDSNEPPPNHVNFATTFFQHF